MAKITSQNLVPFTGTLQPGQRLLKYSDGTFIVVGATTSSGSNNQNNQNNSNNNINELDLFDWMMIMEK